MEGSLTVCRSSERLKKKRSKIFCLPDRKEYLDTIEDLTPSKSFAELRPRKLINYFISGRNRYNNADGQPLSEDDDELRDFIQDTSESDDWDVIQVDDSDESVKEKHNKKPQRKLFTKKRKPSVCVESDDSGDESSVQPTRRRLQSQKSSASEEELKKVQKKRMTLRSSIPIYSNDHLSEKSDPPYESKKPLQGNMCSEPKRKVRVSRRKELDSFSPENSSSFEDVFHENRHLKRKRVIYDGSDIESNNENIEASKYQEMKLSDEEHSVHATEANTKVHKTPVSGSSSDEDVQPQRSDGKTRRIIDDESDVESLSNNEIVPSEYQLLIPLKDVGKHNKKPRRKLFAKNRKPSVIVDSDDSDDEGSIQPTRRRLQSQLSSASEEEELKQVQKKRMTLRSSTHVKYMGSKINGSKASTQVDKTKPPLCDSSSDEDFQTKRKEGKSRRIIDDDSDVESLTNNAIVSSEYQVFIPLKDVGKHNKKPQRKLFTKKRKPSVSVDSDDEGSIQPTRRRHQSQLSSATEEEELEKIQKKRMTLRSLTHVKNVGIKINASKASTQVDKTKPPLCDSSSDEDFQTKRKEGKSWRIIDDDSDVESLTNSAIVSSEYQVFIPLKDVGKHNKEPQRKLFTKNRKPSVSVDSDDEGSIQPTRRRLKSQMSSASEEELKKVQKKKMTLRSSVHIYSNDHLSEKSDPPYEKNPLQGNMCSEPKRKVTRGKDVRGVSRRKGQDEAFSPESSNSSSSEDVFQENKHLKRKRVIYDGSDIESNNKNIAASKYQEMKLSDEEHSVHATETNTKVHKTPVSGSSSDEDVQPQRTEGKTRRIIDNESDVDIFNINNNNTRSSKCQGSTRVKNVGSKINGSKASTQVDKTNPPVCESSSDEDFQRKRTEGKSRRIIDDDNDVESRTNNEIVSSEYQVFVYLKDAGNAIDAREENTQVDKVKSPVCVSSSDEDVRPKKRKARQYRSVVVADDERDVEDHLDYEQRKTSMRTKLRSHVSDSSSEQVCTLCNKLNLLHSATFQMQSQQSL